MGGNSSKIEKRLADKPVVVIIGGGYAGTALAQALDSHVNVLLFERKSHFYHNIAALRGSVQNKPEMVMFPYDQLLKFGHVVHAQVEGIDVAKSTIAVHGHPTPVPYNYLVIATGTSYAFPMKVATPNAKDLVSLFSEFSTAVNKARNITIVGGGPVAIELAGEIADLGKKPTLVQAAGELLPEIGSPEFRADVKRRLEGLGVTVMLGQRIDPPPEANEGGSRDSTSSASASYTTSANSSAYATGGGGDSSASGLRTPGLRYVVGARDLLTDKGAVAVRGTDLVIFATGAATNSDAYFRSGLDMRPGSNRLVVDDNLNCFLRGKVAPNVFALGDCADVERQLAWLAGLQAQAIAKSIKKLVAGGRAEPYKRFTKMMMLVPMGKTEGAAYMDGKILGKKLTGMFKGKELFVSKQKAALGIKSKDAIDYDKDNVIDVEKLANRLHISIPEAQELANNASSITYGADATHT